jgi:mevalonate kinase
LKSIASAPGKIILFGEHFVVHGTKAILAAIDKRVTVTSSFADSTSIWVNSELGDIEVPVDTPPEEVESEFRPFVYLANKMITELYNSRSDQNTSGLEITINSDIPIGVGLGSSSACCVAAAESISGLCEPYWGFHPGEKLLMAIEAEKTIFPDTSGADCTVCTYGGIIEYDKINGWRGMNEESKKNTDTSNLNLLITNSMIPHSTKRSVEKVSKFKEDNEDRFSQLCALETKLIGEVNLALKNKDLTTLGLKMSENQKYLEEIQVSNDTLRDMIHSLKEISLGTKITGAGDGGCIIALVKDENMDKVPELLGKDKECFSAKIDRKGVVWKIEK